MIEIIVIVIVVVLVVAKWREAMKIARKPEPKAPKPRKLATEVRNREKIDADEVFDLDDDQGSILDLEDEEIAKIAEGVPF